MRCSGAVDKSGRSLLSFSWSLLRIVVVPKVWVEGSLEVVVEGRRKRVMRRGTDILLLNTLTEYYCSVSIGSVEIEDMNKRAQVWPRMAGLTSSGVHAAACL